MYSKQLFGQELKKRILSGESCEEIGRWSFEVYWENINEIDNNFDEVLLTLNKMELGSEFAFSREKLLEISESLIKNKDVNLHY